MTIPYIERARRVLAALGIPHSYPIEKNMPLVEEATDLVSVGSDVAGRDRDLAPSAAASWQAMRAAAQGDVITLLLVSAFRSFEQQQKIFERKLKAGQSIDEILAVNAPPGHSEHHSGNAVDLTNRNVRRCRTNSRLRTPTDGWKSTPPLTGSF